jgi:hypothetical protein
MDKDIEEIVEEIGTFRVKMLLMEENIKDRIQMDKEMSGDDWRDLYDAKCSRCERLWESDFMMPPKTENYCIPCWREINDLPKLDPEEDGLVGDR